LNATGRTVNCRSETRSAFLIPLADNPLLIVAVVGAQLLKSAALAAAALHDLLSMQGVTPANRIPVALAGVVVLAVMEVNKLVHRNSRPVRTPIPEAAGKAR